MIHSLRITYYTHKAKKYQDCLMTMKIGKTFTTVSIDKQDIKKVIQRHIKKPQYIFTTNSLNNNIKHVTIQK